MLSSVPRDGLGLRRAEHLGDLGVAGGAELGLGAEGVDDQGCGDLGVGR